MDTEKISVIIPVFNCEKYLAHCMESIVNQTYTNLEIILIDDGSSDACPQLCDAWAESDSRIRVLHKQNEGVSSARNDGLKMATGAYVTFVDADDWIDADMLALLMHAVKSNQAEVALCGFCFEYLQGESTHFIKYENAVYKNAAILYHYLADDNIRPEACGKLIKKSALTDVYFDLTLQYAEDLLFNYYVFKACTCVVCIEDCKYHYLQNSGNSSTTAYITHARAKSYLATKKIVAHEKGTSLEKIAVWRHIRGLFAILSRVISSKDPQFEKMYFSVLRKEILHFKSAVLFQRQYSIKQKMATLILQVSPVVFKCITRLL